MTGEARGREAAGAAGKVGRVRGARPGTSLVEILVAMVVLVIGIFSLVRLFPIGFGTILYGEGVTRGNALTRSELERVRAAAANMPDSVLPITPGTGEVDFTLQPGAEFLPFPNPALPGVPPDPRFSDLNRFRRVLGERVKIPAPTSESPYSREAISLYSVQFSPIYTANAARLRAYSGTPLERVVLDGAPSDAEIRDLGEGRYGVDYRNATLYFAPLPVERLFRVDYSFTVPQGANAFVRSGSVPDAYIYLGPNQTRFDLRTRPADMPANVRFVPLPKGAQLEVDEELVYRAFRMLPPLIPFSRVDPYEFKVLNTLTGMVGFNPLGSSPGNRFGTGGRPLVAKLDYDVEDWHIIREDRVVPQAGPYNVSLTLPNVKQFGDVEESQEQYFSLIRDFSAWPTFPDNDPLRQVTPGLDMVIADLDTGLTIDSLSLNPAGIEAIPAANGDNGRIDYNRGRIEFNPVVRWKLPDATGTPTAPTSIAGRRIRIFYRAEADWAVQITKAFSQYRREVTPQGMGYGQYLQNGPDLYFPPVDHDQSVSVDYTWVQMLSNGQKRLRQESGELHKIKAPYAPDSPQTVGRAPQGLDIAWWLTLNIAGRRDIAPDEPVVIQSVRGASVIARAMWREGPRWRRLEHSTLLPR